MKQDEVSALLKRHFQGIFDILSIISRYEMYSAFGTLISS